MNLEKSIATTDLQAWMATRLNEVRTLTVTFTNNTSYWEVDFWAYELRQTQHLPPPGGFVEYTGIVVGGTKSAPGQQQVAQVNVKIIAHFADCGLVNLYNRSTGKRIPAFNHPDLVAPQGRYFRNPSFGIKDGPGLNSNELRWEFEAELSDGTKMKKEGVIAEA